MVNHFHNPLAPRWAEAGLTIGILFQWFSSVVWQQHPSQDTAPVSNGPGSWSWPNARDRYYHALTLAPKSAREAKFAELFRALGQTMHLVQDASLPAHTRNDPHLTVKHGGRKYGDPDPYEMWVDDLAAKPRELQAFLDSRTPVRPSDEIFKLRVDSPRIDRVAAPAPVSALIDTGQYVGANPDVTRTPATGRPMIGLAEYSNANFFSKDTNSLSEKSVLRRLPFPASSGVTLGPPTKHPKTGEWRRYFSKVRHGDEVDFLAVPSALYEFLPDALRDRKIGLDEVVLEKNAEALLPRAVGYSAALLDHFFRGRLDGAVEIVDDGTALQALVHLTNGTDEPLAGKLEAYGDMADGTRRRVLSFNLTLEPGASLDPPARVTPLPPGTPPPPWLLVFRGALGAEPDAVAAAWAGTAPAVIFVGRTVASGSECSPPVNFDGSFAAWNVGFPMSLDLWKTNGSAVSHVTPELPSCNWFANIIYEPAESEYRALLFRGTLGSPEDRLTAEALGVNVCALANFGGWSGMIPATVEVTGLPVPDTIDQLSRYTLSTLPQPERLIGVVGAGQTSTLDIGEARLIQFRIAQDPPPASLGPAFEPYGSRFGKLTSNGAGFCSSSLGLWAGP